METDPAHISHKSEESLMPRTPVTTVVLLDTGPSTVQKKTEKGVPAQNEVLPLINTNYCLETYEYDNEIVVIHNVKARLKQNIIFWKEKLLLADSSRNLVLPILEYGYFVQFDEEPPSVKLKNNKSTLEHHKFINHAITDLLIIGVVCKIDSLPKVVNPLSVSVNSIRKRKVDAGP